MGESTSPAVASINEYASVEIERKYLLDGLPSLPPHAEAWRIEQAYVGKPPNGGVADLMTGEPASVGGRVRRAVSEHGTVICTHTIKRGQGLVREEYEREITVDQFEEAWRDPAASRLLKTRFRVAVDDRVWEIDEFADLDLVLAEVELPTADAAVVVPPWLADHVQREVTGEAAFSNHAIALRLAEGG